MGEVLLDDHLLRDLLVDEASDELAQLMRSQAPATTNLYLFRLGRSVASARGGTLTGSWSPERRAALGRSMLTMADDVHVVAMRTLVPRMAELAGAHRLSTLGAEAVAAAEELDAPLCVWAGDDGPSIRAALVAIGGTYRTVAR